MCDSRNGIYKFYYYKYDWKEKEVCHRYKHAEGAKTPPTANETTLNYWFIGVSCDWDCRDKG